MTPAQTRRYFWEWARVRDVLKSRGVVAGIDQRRHEIHKQALGVMKSSRDFTNADFDKVLAAFLAITEPDNLNAQLKAIEQPELRVKMMTERIYELAKQVVDKPGSEQRYLDGLSRKVFRCDLADLSERQLGALTGIVTARVRQLERRNQPKQAPGALREAAAEDVPW
jgi:hypothetical protein